MNNDFNNNMNNNMNNNFNNQQPMNNQQFNPTMQGFQQPVNNQQVNPVTQQFQQPVQPQSMYNQPPKKDNKKLFILIGVCVLIAVAVIVLLVVLSGNDSKGNTINDFEDDSVVDTNTQEETEKNDTIAFQGFTLEKQIGYQYKIDETGLTIENSSFATLVSVVPGDLATLKSAQANLINQYSNSGYNPTNPKIEKYGNKEVMTIELTMQGKKVLFYLMDANNNYSFLGMTMNPHYTINYNDIDTTISLLSSAKYIGDYKAPIDELNAIEYKDLFE